MLKNFLNSTFEVEKVFNEEEVIKFAELTGDKNPIHLDENFAKNSIFGERIIHGMLAVSYISKILGMDFPGPGTIYIGQNITFKKPIKINENIIFSLRVISINEEKNNMTISTNCYNNKQEIVISGEAYIKYYEKK